MPTRPFPFLPALHSCFEQSAKAKARIAKAKQALAAKKTPAKHTLEALGRQIAEVKIKHLGAIGSELAKQRAATIKPAAVSYTHLTLPTIYSV